jgi:hypothetical protein
MHCDVHPSPTVPLASSHGWLQVGSGIPSPHTSPDSLRQLALQPSQFVALPSSHSSVLSTVRRRSVAAAVAAARVRGGVAVGRPVVALLAVEVLNSVAALRDPRQAQGEHLGRDAATRIPDGDEVTVREPRDARAGGELVGDDELVSERRVAGVVGATANLLGGELGAVGTRPDDEALP